MQERKGSKVVAKMRTLLLSLSMLLVSFVVVFVIVQEGKGSKIMARIRALLLLLVCCFCLLHCRCAGGEGE